MKNQYFFLFFLFFVSCSGKQPKQANQLSIENKGMSKNNPKNQQETISKSKMIFFEGGTFMLGSNDGLEQESPAHNVTLKPFSIDKTPVTVEQFRIFAEATNYKTEAENFGDSGVFNFDTQQWELLPGAFWQKPFGPNGPEAQNNHPVTHISWNDAVAFAQWAGKRLPSEAEWEFAARSGKNSDNKYSWGNEVSVNGKYFANTWQGTLQSPETTDGFKFTSPVGAFGENEAGLTDMGGNVWQWCADNYKAYPGSSAPISEDPNVKAIRSGSFFFDEYGDKSLTVSFRSMNSHETSLFNTGFRCAKDGK